MPSSTSENHKEQSAFCKLHRFTYEDTKIATIQLNRHILVSPYSNLSLSPSAAGPEEVVQVCSRSSPTDFTRITLCVKTSLCKSEPRLQRGCNTAVSTSQDGGPYHAIVFNPQFTDTLRSVAYF